MIHLDLIAVVGRKRGLSQDCKNTFILLLSLFGSSEPMRCHYLSVEEIVIT